jgi:5-methylcytosine-specific restriction endonuclease McrA
MRKTKAIRANANYTPKVGRNGRHTFCALCGKDVIATTGNTIYCEECKRIMIIYYIRRRSLRKQGAGGTHTKKEFNDLCARMKWQCEYCGKQLNMKTATEDHIVAIASGGDDSILNIAVACRSCNSSKQTRPADVFLELMEQKRATG